MLLGDNYCGLLSDKISRKSRWDFLEIPDNPSWVQSGCWEWRGHVGYLETWSHHALPQHTTTTKDNIAIMAEATVSDGPYVIASVRWSFHNFSVKSM